MEKTFTHDQQRARYAWEKAEEAGGRGLIDEYTRQAKSAASLIMNSGLMQTLAFLQAKNGEEHEMLKTHLCKWLGRILGGAGLVGGGSFPSEQRADFEQVMNALYRSDSDLYMRTTSETIALLRWVRQLADARKLLQEKQERLRIEAEQTAAEEKRLASMSPLELEINQVTKDSSDQKDDYLVVLDELKAGHWQEAKKKEVAVWVSEQMQQQNKWVEKSNKKNPRKDKNYMRTLEIMKIMEKNR